MMRHAALLLAVVGLVSVTARQLPVSIGTSLMCFLAGRAEQVVIVISEDHKIIKFDRRAIDDPTSKCTASRLDPCMQINVDEPAYSQHLHLQIL